MFSCVSMGSLSNLAFFHTLNTCMQLGSLVKCKKIDWLFDAYLSINCLTQIQLHKLSIYKVWSQTFTIQPAPERKIEK